MLRIKNPTFSTIEHNWSYSSLYKKFQFNLIGILQSQDNPNAHLHFIYPALIL